MKLTIDTLNELTIGANVWLARGFAIPGRYTYMGLVNGYYILVLDYGSDSIRIISNGISGNAAFSNGDLFTTYESCCARMREQCLDAIEHFNKHQLKAHPIVVL